MIFCVILSIRMSELKSREKSRRLDYIRKHLLFDFSTGEGFTALASLIHFVSDIPGQSVEYPVAIVIRCTVGADGLLMIYDEGEADH